ncbi:MAG: peptide deformylase [Clostridia bacterium]|nr:peptide deformylase [Clostridia bacterium]
MAIRNLRYDTDEILKKRSKEIEVIDDKIKELAEDMMETMHKYDGVGLAAPQVGILKRLIVIDLYEEGTQYILINPVIVKSKGEQMVDEGCLSFPNQYGKVKRPKEVEVVGLDLNGEKIRIKAKDLLAQALSHEIDHLDGILFTSKVEPGTLETVTPDEKQARKEERRNNRKK